MWRPFEDERGYADLQWVDGCPQHLGSLAFAEI